MLDELDAPVSCSKRTWACAMARDRTVVPRSGRRGRRFKSCHPDSRLRRSQACGAGRPDAAKYSSTAVQAAKYSGRCPPQTQPRSAHHYPPPAAPRRQLDRRSFLGRAAKLARVSPRTCGTGPWRPAMASFDPDAVATSPNFRTRKGRSAIPTNWPRHRFWPSAGDLTPPPPATGSGCCRSSGCSEWSADAG